jgi:hypothetical protein
MHRDAPQLLDHVVRRPHHRRRVRPVHAEDWRRGGPTSAAGASAGRALHLDQAGAARPGGACATGSPHPQVTPSDLGAGAEPILQQAELCERNSLNGRHTERLFQAEDDPLLGSARRERSPSSWTAAAGDDQDGAQREGEDQDGDGDDQRP